MIGQRLGPYEITAKLGEGGMGEVYRARDTKLERDVAIKVLPAAFVEDHERLARFEREAKLLAQLHHPNIASIFGMEESAGTKALVMELVEGPTLAERLESGSLPINESLLLARQIAEALEEAHEKGIIHRDLKPQNIKASMEGKVKVLDFGLAKAMDPMGAASGAQSASQLAASPTLTLGATQMGVVLGTAAYMAPEQAKGFAVDKRCDIWAFGVVLFEMLSGKRLFEGDSVPETLAGVLKNPIDLESLPAEVPPAVRRLLRRCLERDPRMRLRDIGDAKLELSEGASSSADAAAPAAAVTGGRRGWLWPLLAVAALVVGFGSARLLAPAGSARAAPVRARLTLALPADAPLASGNFLPALTFSPDGSSLAFVAVGNDGVRRLAVRRLDSAEVKVIPGTEGAEDPFFSPDGEWIGFWSKWKVRKVRASGLGVPEVICNSLDFRGGTWAGHKIVFTPKQTGPLFQVDDSGGTPSPLTQLLPDERNHRFPHALPDGDTILFTSWKPPFDVERSGIVALSLATGKRREVGSASHDVRYSPSGHLLYVQAGRLLAVPFDLGRLEITGPARAILDHVMLQKNTGAAQFAVSRAGALAWAAGELVGNEVRVTRVDRNGNRTTIFETDSVRRHPKLSPDGSRFLVEAIGPEVDGEWLESIDGNSHRRLSTVSRVNYGRWLADGGWVYSSDAGTLVADSIDGSSPPRELVPASADVSTPTGASASGTIAYDVFSKQRGLEGWLVDLEKGQPRPFLSSPANEGGVTFSPDGRYVAYVSDRSGDFEVYVTSYPDKAGLWQISTAGGSEVVWRRDGQEIAFRSGSDLVTVPVTTDPTFHAGTPTVLFHVPYEGVLGTPNLPNYDESRDGGWFLMTENPDLNRPSASVEIAFDWPSVLKGN